MLLTRLLISHLIGAVMMATEISASTRYPLDLVAYEGLDWGVLRFPQFATVPIDLPPAVHSFCAQHRLPLLVKKHILITIASGAKKHDDRQVVAYFLPRNNIRVDDGGRHYDEGPSAAVLQSVEFKIGKSSKYMLVIVIQKGREEHAKGWVQSIFDHFFKSYPDTHKEGFQREHIETQVRDFIDTLNPKTQKPEYNQQVYGRGYVSQMERCAADPAFFATFKTKNHIDIWNTFFLFWIDNVDISQRALQCLHENSPHLLDHFPHLAQTDRSIGEPQVFDFIVPSALVNAATNQNLVVQSSPLVPRYLFELMMLEHSFGRSAFTRDLQILEIGGGYGGMAAAVTTVHTGIRRYSIVDLDAVGKLVQKYAEVAHIPNLYTISSKDAANVTSDLLISFFSISEQKYWELLSPVL